MTRVITVGDFRLRLLSQIAEGGFSYVHQVEVLNNPAFQYDRAMNSLLQINTLSSTQIKLLTELRAVPKTCRNDWLSRCESILENSVSVEFIRSLWVIKGQYLALKIIPVQSQGQLRNAFREINVLQALSASPHVVSLLASSVQKSNNGIKNVYLVSPLYKQKVQRNISDTLKLFKNICIGVRSMHSFGFCHKDIKPSNIVYGNTSTNHPFPIIIDIGSADSITSKSRTELQDAAEISSTASYRAPELYSHSLQFEDIIGSACDVWSLGCTLYHMLYQSNPFESTTEGVLTLSILSGTVKFPTNSSDWNNKLIRKMLEVDTEKRITLSKIISEIQEWENSTTVKCKTCKQFVAEDMIAIDLHTCVL